MKRLLALAALALVLVGQAIAATANFTADTTTILSNPGRGFHFQSGNLDNWTSMDLPNFPADAAGLATPITNATLNNVVTSVATGGPSPTTLTNWDTSLAACQTYGIMCGLRFMHSGTAAQMVASMVLMKPLLAKYAHVIPYIQAGFCGDYGEWAEGGAACTTSGADKTTIQAGLMANMPPNIPIEFTQMYALNQWYGPTPIDQSEAFTDTFKARSAFHSDCFLTGQGDSSMYPGAGSYGGFNSTTTEAQKRAYVANASRWVMFGGETCNGSVGAAASMRIDCSGGNDNSGLPPSNGLGGILNEGPRYHVSHLNISYAPNFHARWASGAGGGPCLATVNRLMGYRLQLDNATAPATMAKGSTTTVTVNMRNYGWAVVPDPRILRIVGIHTNGTNKVYGEASAQLRQCPPQATSSDCKMSIRVTVPSNALSGTYNWHLWAPSSYAAAQALRPFMIRFANANSGGQVWNDTTGMMATGLSTAIP